MFGYVVLDKSTIKNEEHALFGAFYCGLCKLIGQKYGQIWRYTTNYDITFFALLAHDQLNQAVTFGEERCLGNPFVKRPIIRPNPLLDRIADLNIIFSYYKLQDNVIDGSRGAKVAKKMLQKAYGEAAKKQPNLDKIINDGYSKLRKLEQNNESSIDRVSDCFSQLLYNCGQDILGESATHNALKMIYNVGKFVYLADALDDIDEDSKKNRYNPFLASLGEFSSRQDFIQRHKEFLTFIFAITTNRAIECFNGMRFNQSYSLLRNIIYFGLRKKIDELFSSKKKLKRPKL